MGDFSIAAAQVPSVRGDLDANLAVHATAIEAAARHGVSLVVFPELSLTGYEPDLAADLALTPSDARLGELRRIARDCGVDAVVGLPLRDGPGKPKLGALVIGRAIQAYHKMHLGGAEPAYFEPGSTRLLMDVDGYKVGVAICADSSCAAHPETYARAGAHVYAAGVFLTSEWYRTDTPRLARYAKRHRFLTVMANQAASVGTYESVGGSTVWNPDGEVLVQARGTEDVLLIARCGNGTWRGEAVAL